MSPLLVPAVLPALLLALLPQAAAQAPVTRAPVRYPAVIPPDQPITQGEVRVATMDGIGTLVLTHTDVHAEIRAGMARVSVTQTFENPYDEGLEATYLFPLPPDAAVDAMEMRIGDRRVAAELKTRADAREAYDQARDNGQRAALLEQERPNLFTQSITGLCPGDAVQVTLTYLHEVELDRGTYRLDFPMTVGPRYAPGDLVPDAPRLATPLARDGRDITLSVAIDEGMPIRGLWSDTHDIDVVEEGAWGAEIELEAHDRLPNKDFSLEWSLATDQPVGALLTHRPDPDRDGYLALRLEPQVLEDLVAVRPRELLFVIDSSGSMQGQPYETAREAVLRSLEGMRPGDTFNLVQFSSAASSLFATPQPATAQTIARAADWLADFQGGGTNMHSGIVHSLELPGDPDALRLVLLLTDGWIGQEDMVFDVAEEHLGDARIFALGVGSAPNRWLLEGLSELGRGALVQADHAAPIDEAVDDFLSRIAHPAMTDITVDWGQLDVDEVYPSRIPDLWAGQTLTLSGRYDTPLPTGDLPTTVTVSGLVDGAPFTLELPVEAPAQASGDPEVAILWARRALHDGTLRAFGRPDDATVERLTSLALRYGLVSAWTALVAVDDAEAACTIERSVAVPQLAAQGSDHAQDMAAAGQAGVLGSLIGTKGMQLGAGGLASRGSALASRGSALGGGGTAQGLGGLGTAGRGGGGFGSAGGSGAGNSTASSAPAVTSAPSIVLGSIDKNVIDATIQRHINQVRYCYERELRANPALAGKVTVKFVIAADGTVSKAEIKASTMGSDAVEQCLVDRFLRMQFPKPAGGGIVVVSYPFLFSPR